MGRADRRASGDLAAAAHPVAASSAGRRRDHYVDDHALAQISACLPALAEPSTSTVTVTSGGVTRVLAGQDDPQLMWMLLLQILTGRRASEICLCPFDCLSPATDSAIEAAEGDAVARFRYGQSKIDTAPDTILVDAETAAVIEEQQQWLRDRFPGRDLPYLFPQRRANAHGTKPCGNSTEDHDALHLLDRADRFLPNGYCLLPPLQKCEKGNACLTCSVFVTDDSHLAVLQRQLEETAELIERTTARFLERHGRPMPEGNVWLVEREAERDALARLLAAMQASPGRAIKGAGSPSSPVPVSIDLDRHRKPQP